MFRPCRCPCCGQVTEEGVLQFQQLRSCPGCGLTANEGAFKMQEELSDLFNSKMQVSAPSQSQKPPEDNELSTNSSAASALGYSSSQHYYPPPAHLASKTRAELPQDCGSDLRGTLSEHGIDHSHLLSSQIELFREAAPEQRRRLAELWRIAPMEHARIDGLGGEKETTLEQEEELACMRYEWNSLANNGRRPDVCNNPDVNSASRDTSQPEPYMKSGYELLAERDYNEQRGVAVRTYQQALDPAFAGREWWRDFVAKQPMEYQYGILDHFCSPEIEIKGDEEDLEMS